MDIVKPYVDSNKELSRIIYRILSTINGHDKILITSSIRIGSQERDIFV